MHRKPPRRRNLWLALILNLAGIAGYLAFRWSDLMTVGWFAPWPEAVLAALGTVVCFSAALAAATTLLFGPLGKRRPGPFRRAAAYIDLIKQEHTEAPGTEGTDWPRTYTPEQAAERTDYLPVQGKLSVVDAFDWRGTEQRLLTHAPMYGGYVNIPDDGRANTGGAF